MNTFDRLVVLYLCDCWHGGRDAFGFASPIRGWMRFRYSGLPQCLRSFLSIYLPTLK